MNMDTTSALQPESTKAMTIDAWDAKQTLLTSINEPQLFSFQRVFFLQHVTSLMLSKLRHPRALPVVVYRGKEIQEVMPGTDDVEGVGLF